MATYQVKGPNGETYQIDGPDDADPSAVIAQVTGQHRFGSGAAGMKDAIGGQLVPSNSPEAQAARNPANQPGTLQPFGIDTGIPIGVGGQNFFAGAGKATTDLIRGAGQMIPTYSSPTLSGQITGDKGGWGTLVSRQDVADSRARDKALMSTTAGNAGNITGNVLDLLPTAFIPGSSTLLGAGAIGAGTGLLQPSTSTKETLLNTGIGGVTAPAAVLAGRGIGALYQGAKSAVEPFFRGGQERIAARTLQSFAGDDNAVQQAVHNILQGGGQTLPGVTPTTAELANNAGLAQLERTLRNNPEALTALTERLQANRGAMTGALQGIGGTDAQLAAAQAARGATTAPLYDAARSAAVPADAELAKLLERPSLQAAMSRASQIAAERGETLATGNQITGNTLQYLKMALQDTVNTGAQQGIGSHELGAVRSTLSDLQSWIGRKVPELRAADQAFAAGSAPINQMEIGRALSDRLQPALADFGNNTRLNAASFANAVRNGDQLAANVTGNSRATLEGTLTQDQNNTIRQIAEQLARRANADELGRAVGSNTGQNLASQNLLRQFLGPLGLPEGMGERAAQSTLGQSILRPFQFGAKVGEPRVMETLTRAALDPQYAAGLLRRVPTSRAAQILWARQGLLGPIGTTGALGLMGSGYAAEQ